MEDPFTLFWLFLAALAAGCMDTVAGGGGLITLPALIAVGFPPQVALGTNKLQATFGSGGATLHFARAGALSPRDCLLGVAFTAAGAAAGAYAVGLLSPALLRAIVPFLLIAVATAVLVSPRLGHETKAARMKHAPFFALFGLSLGFYDGFFGPGTGTFWTVAMLALLGLDATRATATTKAVNFTSNIVSLAVFLALGVVSFLPGFVMAAGQFAGAWVGARLVLWGGARVVRPVLAVVAFALAASLLFQTCR